jgi:hypothetical protein
MSISSHLASGLDPVRLARQLGMEPDDWQGQLLRSPAPRSHVLCSRQVGKSTTASIAALAKAMYRPASLTLIVSPTMRQSQELFGAVKARYRQLGKPIESESENQLSLTLENQSRILSVPGTESGSRGYTVDLLVIDEAARVDDEIFAALSPMLAVSRGRVIALSTPAGKRGWFYEASKSPAWEHYRVPATSCQRISPEFLAGERDALGDMAYRQEYLCEWVDAAGAAFSGEDIAAVFAPVPDRSSLPETGVTPPPVHHPPADGVARALAQTNRRRVRRGPTAAAEPLGRRNCAHRWRADGANRLCVFCGLLEQPPEAC